MRVRVIYNSTKEYSNMFKVSVFNKPFAIYRTNRVKRPASQVADSSYTPTVSSLARTKTLVRDLVICNDFELFVTLTFDPKRVDSFSYAKCFHVVSVWLHHQKDRATLQNKRFKYIVVPERHKSGAWHFHALLSGYCGSIKESGHYTRSGRPIYNLSSYRNGFTTAVYIDDSSVVASYIVKYITKDFVKKFNKRRFTCSRDLVRPIKFTNSHVLDHSLPLVTSLSYQNDVVQVYTVLKTGEGL